MHNVRPWEEFKNIQIFQNILVLVELHRKKDDGLSNTLEKECVFQTQSDIVTIKTH